MLASTLDEKENRVTEMILTTINPTALILGKIVSLFAARPRADRSCSRSRS